MSTLNPVWVSAVLRAEYQLSVNWWFTRNLRLRSRRRDAESDRSQGRNTKDYSRACVVWLAAISLENIGSDDAPLVARHGRQRQARGGGGVARGIDGGIGNALQEVVDRNATRAVLDIRFFQPQIGDLGNAPCAVDDQVGLDLDAPRRMYRKAVRTFFISVPRG